MLSIFFNSLIRLAQVLQAAVDRVFSPHNIKSGFRKAGIFPLNKDAIDKTLLAPKDPEFNTINIGPGGDNSSTQNPSTPDPLCHSCGQFVMGHPLVNQGLIPKDLADVLVPIIGTSKQKKATRVVTQSRVITGEEIYDQLKEKEEKKTKTNKKKKQQTNSDSTPGQDNSKLPKAAPKKRAKKNIPETLNDNKLPKLSAPKKRTKKAREEQVGDLADPEFTCAICSIQGHTRDEEIGIFWVGCDNTMTCNRWFHRDCLPHSEHAEVDLSVITGSTWHCHLCNIFAIAQDVETEDPATDVICQVCMASCTLNELENGIDLFWIDCRCGKSFHKSCLPVTVYRQWDLAKDKWCCGQCPDDM